MAELAASEASGDGHDTAQGEVVWTFSAAVPVVGADSFFVLDDAVYVAMDDVGTGLGEEPKELGV
jgi:hypothetical protein